MNERFDDGKILIRGKLKMFPEESPQILHYRTAELCALLLPIAINRIESDDKGMEIVEEARYFFKLKPEEFREYRQYNEQNPHCRRLTPHKSIQMGSSG